MDARSIWLRARGYSLQTFLRGWRFKSLGNRIAKLHGGASAAPQVGRNEHINSSSCTFWNYGVGSQFELYDPVIESERRNAIAIDEGSYFGSNRSNFNSW